jgi:hypothetical protein
MYSTFVVGDITHRNQKEEINRINHRKQQTQEENPYFENTNRESHHQSFRIPKITVFRISKKINFRITQYNPQICTVNNSAFRKTAFRI